MQKSRKKRSDKRGRLEERAMGGRWIRMNLLRGGERRGEMLG